jgi:hypothetical protein
MINSGDLNSLMSALRDGDEPLDRGTRGPGVELELLRDAGLIRAPSLMCYLRAKPLSNRRSGSLR